MSPAPDGTVTWRELLAGAVDRLARAGLDTSETDARRIAATAAGCTDAELSLELSRPATEGGVARLDAMIARRVLGEPLQYVLGSWGFRRLDLMVDRRVLIPRPETEQVVEVALAELDRLGAQQRTTIAVDLGTGSGAIGLSIAVERVRCEVWLTDRSADALAVASANLAGTGRVGARVRTVAGEWFDALPTSLRGRIDVVVSNPPYVPEAEPLPPEVTDWEPTVALRSGPDGTDDLRHLLGAAPEWLAPDGALVLELSPEQASPMAEIAAASYDTVRVEADLSGRDRCLVSVGPVRGPIR